MTASCQQKSFTPGHMSCQTQTPMHRGKVDLELAVRDHYQVVYRFAWHLTRHQEDAADLTQHAYAMLLENHESITDTAKVRAWLQSTVYRKFIDQKRRIIRFPQVEYSDEVLPESAQEADAGERLDARAALEALQLLEDELRAPLSLFYLNQCSYREIARILELPVGTVMSRLHRGKKLLYETLTQPK